MQRSIRSVGTFWLILASTLFCSAINAEEDLTFPSETKFVLQFDLKALRDTELGSQLVKFVRERIVEEIANEAGSGKGPSLEKINNVLGFDPLEEIQQITLAASDYEHPEKSLCAIVNMRGTTGNLEGLMLALPGYDTGEYHNHQVHTASPDEDVTFFASIVDGRSNGKQILLSPDRSVMETLLDRLDGRSRSRRNDQARVVESSDAIVDLQILELPTESWDEGPHTNIAKILKDLSVQIREAGDDIEVVLSVKAQKPEMTNQLRQMAQGLLAVLDLAKSMEPDDEDLQAFVELVHDLDTRVDGDAIQVVARVDSDKLMELVEHELK